MATPRLTSIRLTPAIRVDIRSAGGDRPAVVVFPAVPALAERLARAGFAVISFDGEPSDGLAIVVAALARGELGFKATAVGVIGGTPLGAVGVPWLEYRNDPDAAVRWCGEHLAC